MEQASSTTSLELGSLKSQAKFFLFWAQYVENCWDGKDTPVLIHYNAEEIQVESMNMAVLQAKSNRMKTHKKLLDLVTNKS